MYFLMTPEHPNWEEFSNRLDELLSDNGCCHDHSACRRALHDMGSCEMEIIGCVKWFCENHGYCDCEVMMNVVCE